MKKLCPYCKQWFTPRPRHHHKAACYSLDCEEAFREDRKIRNRQAQLRHYYRNPEKWKAKSRQHAKMVKNPEKAWIIKKCLQCGRTFKTEWHPGDSKTRGRCDMCKHYENRRYSVADYGAHDVRYG